VCGRYASARPVEEIAAAFGIAADDADASISPDWNVAPTKPVPVVVQRDDRQRLVRARWGLVPSWADDPSIGTRLINARIETVAERPAFRDALVSRRCLLPADGWYEWRLQPDGSRQAYFLHPADGSIAAFAGLWESWRDAEGRAHPTVTILTGPAPEDVAHVHDRAPVLLAPDEWSAWLDPARRAATELLRATRAGVVLARPVGPEVGDVRANGPRLVEAVTVAEQAPLF
jgi:putative SOS response-associated peptidase YedK